MVGFVLEEGVYVMAEELWEKHFVRLEDAYRRCVTGYSNEGLSGTWKISS